MKIYDILGYDNLYKVFRDCLFVKFFLIIRVNIFVVDGSRIYLGVNKNIKIKI